MINISVVIITKNEAANITDCILSARKISSDIVVVDTGSKDATPVLAKQANVHVVNIEWRGYGYSKNTGAAIAKHDWIFSLDADERITEEMAVRINHLSFAEPNTVYSFRRQNYFGNKKIRFGSFAHDRVCRLYNKKQVHWNSALVHEKLCGGNNIVPTKAFLLHYAIMEQSTYIKKIMGYALLCAVQYKQDQRKFAYVRGRLGPLFNFIKGYIFLLGLLDNRQGYIIAKLTALYTRKKYEHLIILNSAEKKPSFLLQPLRKFLSFLS